MASLELEARLDSLLSTGQAETANVDLFAPIQISKRRECPICMIPLPIKDSEIMFMSCCGKNICMGCICKRVFTEIKKDGLSKSTQDRCAFCCQPSINSIKEIKKLMKKNDPQAFIQMAMKYKSGIGLFQSDTKALEHYIRAAELGHDDAYALIGDSYLNGLAVEENMTKAFEFYEIAAKKGSVYAQKRLAYVHGRNGNIPTSIQHYRVAASAGDKVSLDHVMKCYKKELLSKEDLTKTLRSFQESNDLMESEDRDNARAVGASMRQKGSN